MHSFLALSFVSIVAAHWNGPARPLAPRQTAGSPCAAVSASAASILAATPSATPIVSGSLAYECLNSVSLHTEDALALWDSIRPYVDWQSDLNYKKDPPAGYRVPAADIYAELDVVRTKIEDATYANEYQFQADLFRVFNLAKDGHFRYFPDLLTSVIKFQRNVGLVSVSPDGLQVPQIFELGDVQKSSGNVTTTASPVVAINGQDAVTFAETLSQLGVLQDPDALYNTLFYSKAFDGQTPGWRGYFGGSGRFGNIWPGASTILTFENGTSRNYTTTANIIRSFSGVTDGETFYQKFCTGQTSTSANSTATATATGTATAIPTSTSTAASTAGRVYGYPEPVVISSDTYASGYYLDGENSDVAVLSLLSYSPHSPAEFQAVIQAFLADAKDAGKTKLVVDLAANGGGYILLGHDTFRQLFPQIVEEGNNRYRETDAFNALSEIFSAGAPSNFTPSTASDLEITLHESPFDYRYDINLTNQHFPSFSAKFSPHLYKGYNYTSLMRWDLNDPLTTSNSSYGLGTDVTGFRSRQNFTQPFAAEDIILLYDGYCASTCTLFSEFMRTQGNVKSITFGGRPQAQTPIQNYGGIKGANNYAFSYINSLASFALDVASAVSPSTDTTPLQAFNTYALGRASDTSINVRDNILPDNVNDGTPAQYIYEESDCRLFYTPEMINDVTAIWNAAANAAFRGAECAYGGISSTNASSTPRRSSSSRIRGTSRQQHPIAKRSLALAEIEFEVPVKDETWVARNGRPVPI